jgi:hypothetical protein
MRGTFREIDAACAQAAWRIARQDLGFAAACQSAYVLKAN